MSNIVADVLMQYLPSKRKTTPSGWCSFDAPCCVHNGESRDERQRGGLIQEGDVVSYHCFNCGYKTGWQPGRLISYKLRKLLEWFNVPDDTINKLSLEAMRIGHDVNAQEFFTSLPEFATVQLPEESVKIKEVKDFNEQSLSVIEYMLSRNLNLDDTDYYLSSKLGYRDRLIIPFYYEGRIVGWTARAINSDKKPKYLSDSQPGFVYNLDEQRPQKVFCIVVEGPIDATHIEGVALLGSEINEQQAMLLNRLGKEIIVVPDRDKAGKKLVEQAIDQEWSVSMPDWDSDINDVSDCVAKHGRIYTLYSIVSAAESSALKIRLKAKKWFD